MSIERDPDMHFITPALARAIMSAASTLKQQANEARNELGEQFDAPQTTSDRVVRRTIHEMMDQVALIDSFINREFTPEYLKKGQ